MSIRMFSIIRYSPDKCAEWDSFIRGSRNATFLLEREYMDYHSHRFRDYSLMIYKGDSLCALLPANISEGSEGRVLCSHAGLTYGGLVLPPRHLDATDVLEIFRSLKEFGKSENIRGLDYKAMPYIYSRMPSQEDIYAIQRMGGIMKQGNLSCCVDLEHNPGFNTQQKRNLKRAEKSGLEIEQAVDVAEFHLLLSQCLSERYSAVPVHSVEELTMLAERFPDNIRFYGVRSGTGSLVAGTCLYYSEMVAHTQYICSSAYGREKGALTLLVAYLIDNLKGSVRYLDFGTSNEDQGRYLNPGLYRQKSSLGGSGVAYPRYYIDFTV